MTQTVLITGAGIGIGRAAAKAFGKAGYHVIVTDVLEKEGQAVAAEIGKNAEFHKLDVRSTENANAVIAAVEKKHGALDCIVANAGIAHKVPVAQLTDEKWDHTFDTATTAPFLAVRIAGRAARTTRKIPLRSISKV